MSSVFARTLSELCNIDLLTNIGTDCADESDESVERALLVDDNRNCFDAYADDSEGLKYGVAERKQRRKEENMFARERLGGLGEDD